MSTPFLFIGGSADGRRIAVPTDMFTVRFASRTAIGDHEGYSAQLIVGGNEEFIVFVSDSLTAADAMRALIEKYPSPKL